LFHQARSRPREPERPVFHFLFSALATQLSPVADLWFSFHTRSSLSARAESSGIVFARGVTRFWPESGAIAASSLLSTVLIAEPFCFYWLWVLWFCLCCDWIVALKWLFP
jgi:hypothetical protein